MDLAEHRDFITSGDYKSSWITAENQIKWLANLKHSSKTSFSNRESVAQLVEHRTVMQEVGRTNTQGLKITEEKVLPF